MGRGSSSAPKRKSKKPRPVKAEPPVNEFAKSHGDYRSVSIVDLSGELGGRRQSIVKAVQNHSVTHVDGWFAQRLIGFEEPQLAAVNWMRSLWRRVGTSRITMNWGEATGGGSDDGAAQANALAEISTVQRKFPPKIWSAFEDAARWDNLPENEHSQAYDYHRFSTAFVAGMIAMWRGF